MPAVSIFTVELCQIALYSTSSRFYDHLEEDNELKIIVFQEKVSKAAKAVSSLLCYLIVSLSKLNYFAI